MAGIQALLATEQDEAQAGRRPRAMAAGRALRRGAQYGRTTTPEVAGGARAGRRGGAGADPRRCSAWTRRAAPLSAAAPLPPEVAAFFAGLGMRILDVYGMTETTGAFTANTAGRFKLGTVGRAVPGIEITARRGRRDPGPRPAHHPGLPRTGPRRPPSCIDADGWLHTGDIGALDADGFRHVVDRKKELIITAGGENISPAAIENLLKEHPLIGQALAYGDRRPYVVALLTLDGEVAPGWAAGPRRRVRRPGRAGRPPGGARGGRGRRSTPPTRRLARVQQVKRWRLLPVEWTAETEELTPTPEAQAPRRPRQVRRDDRGACTTSLSVRSGHRAQGGVPATSPVPPAS